MKIDGKAPIQGPEGRRFQAAKSASAQEGGKSFGALLKKASETKPAQSQPAAPAPAHAAAPSQAEPKAAASEAKSADEPVDFANHMEMVKLRLKSGYYNNQNVNDALSEKLTGFFDDLA